MTPINIQYSKAYSLTEMAMVMLIMALMYSTAAPVYLKMVDEKRGSTATEDIETMSVDIETFFAANGRFPDSLDEVFNPVPLDPWGNPYEYLNIHDQPNKSKGKLRKDKNLVPINSDYDLYSKGPDGRSTSPLTANISRDDIVRGRNGDFVGDATKY